jgi:hypothetical protein
MADIDETNDALCNPGLIDDIARAVAAGGTLAQFCGSRDLDHGIIRTWLSAGEQGKRYAAALDIRDDYARDIVFGELMAYMKSDLTQAFDERGDLRKLHEMPSEVRRMVSGFKFREVFDGKGDERVHVGNIIEAKFLDKLKAIELMARKLSMLTDKTQHEVGPTLEALLEQSMQPVSREP